MMCGRVYLTPVVSKSKVCIEKLTINESWVDRLTGEGGGIA